MKIKWKKKIARIMTICLVASLFTMVSTKTAKAASITVDGNFDDWSSVGKTNCSKNDDFMQAAAVWKDGKVYVYISEAEGKSCSITWGNNLTLAGDDGKNIGFTSSVKSGGYGSQSIELKVTDTQSWQEMSGVTAKGAKLANGSYQYEFVIPAEKLKDAKTITLKDKNGNVLVANVEKNEVAKPTVTPIQTAKPTSKPSAKPTQKPASGPIVIDGYYDDWTGFDQKDAFTWLSNNKQCSHVGGIYMDDKNVYVHVKLHKYYMTHIPVNNYVLTVNGKNISCFGQFADDNGNIIYDNRIYNLPVGTTTSLGVFNQEGSHEFLGKLAITVADKKVIVDEDGQRCYDKMDQFEFAVSLETLSRITGIPVESIKTVSFSCSNLGGDQITTSGTSTGPWIGIGICVLVAGGILVYRKKRKQVTA